MLDITGPAEVFAEANRAGANYVLTHASPGGGQVVTSIGARLPTEPAPAGDQGGTVDTLLVAGGDRLVGEPMDAGLVAAVSSAAGRAARVASVCTGSTRGTP